MRSGRVFYLLGRSVTVIGLTMSLPLLVALFYREGDLWVFGLSMPLMIGVGLLLRLRFRSYSGGGLRQRESFLFVTLTWTAAGLLGAVPYLLYGCFPTVSGAIFESFSGFTTTGATALADVEVLPHALLLWRSLTQWLGGVGIVLLFITLIHRDQSGNEGVRVFKAEFSGGALVERVTARVEDNAQAVITVYLTLTAACFGCLLLTGLPFLEALNHTLTTVATGGFSTRNASIGAFNNPAAEWVVAVFLFLSGVNLALYYLFFVRGLRRRAVRDTELRVFALVVAVCTVLITVDLKLNLSVDSSGGECLRHAFFQVVSIMTSGGFCTQDYDLWPHLSRLLLILLIAVGSCAGSTSGSIKLYRFCIVWQSLKREISYCFRPLEVWPLTYNGKVISERTARSSAYYFFLFALLVIVGTLICTLCGMDWLEAFFGCLASVSNVGPAWGDLGPAGSFAAVPGLAKYTMCFLMLAGRLELYTVLVLFTPAVWKK